MDGGVPFPLVSYEGQVTTDSSWSPDGKVIASQTAQAGRNYDIWMRPIDGEPEMFLGAEFNEGRPAFSPDGRWLAYDSDASGRVEVFVTPYPGPGRAAQVSIQGGRAPLWALDGREIYYRHDGAVMAVAVLSAEPELELGQPVMLFDGPYTSFVRRDASKDYDVAPDGRFVMVRPEGGVRAVHRLNVILNWFQELERLVPTEH